MSDGAPAAPQAQLKHRRRFSVIWIIPLVAATVALWLGYKTLSERGPTIEITFRTATGLVAGKTQIRYKDVVLGTVGTLTLSADLVHVTATAEMDKTVAPHLTEGTRFWVVSPRIGLSGISGLDTLVSGAYIGMDPGEGAPATKFLALDEPPVIRSDVAGTEFSLRADRLGSISRGSPVFFRDLQVGEILGYDTADIEQSVVLHAFVRAPFDRYVFAGTRFWNASGLSITTGVDGFRIEFESLQALLGGGVVFDTPLTARIGEPSREGTEFALYKDAQSVQDAGYTKRLPFLVYFTDSVSGLEAGSPVEWQGIKIGRVLDVKLQFDAATSDIRVPVLIEIEPQRIEVVGGTASADGTILPDLVRRGLRAQLRSGSFITGQLVVALDFFPDDPAAAIGHDGRYAVIPSVPGQLSGIVRSVDQVLGNIAKLPLEGLIDDARGTLQAFRTVAADPEIEASLSALTAALTSASELLKTAQSEIGPALEGLPALIAGLDRTARRASTALASLEEGYGGDSSFRRNVAQLINQTNDAIRALRILAVELQENPESLIRGRTGD
jgi:paraquat-inducible protein B